MIMRLLRDLSSAAQLVRSRRTLMVPYADAVGLAALAAIHAGVRARENRRRFVRAGTRAIAVTEVARVETTGDRVILVERGGREHVLAGFDAVEALHQLAPSLLEGRRLRWPRHAWAVHNLVAHPAMQLAAWLGAPRLGLAIHDATVPRPGVRATSPGKSQHLE
jgi:hypothetical protein